jgi:hypothetical protein
VAMWVMPVDAAVGETASMADRRKNTPTEAPQPTEAPRDCGERVKPAKPRAGVMWVVSAAPEPEPPAAEADIEGGSTEKGKGLTGTVSGAENEGPQPNGVRRSHQHPRGIAWVA